MTVRLAPALLVATIVAGCSGTAPRPADLPQQGRIGVMFLTEPEPTHVFVGPAGRKETPLPTWQFEDAAVALVKSTVGSRFDVVRVEPTGPLRAADGILNAGWKRLHLDERFAPDFGMLRDAHQLDALVVLEPYRHEVEPGAPVEPQGHGVYTHCAAAGCRTFAFHRIAPMVFTLRPPTLLDGWGTQDKHARLEIDVGADGTIAPDHAALARAIYLRLLKADLRAVLGQALNLRSGAATAAVPPDAPAPVAADAADAPPAVQPLVVTPESELSSFEPAAPPPETSSPQMRPPEPAPPPDASSLPMRPPERAAMPPGPGASGAAGASVPSPYVAGSVAQVRAMTILRNRPTHDARAVVTVEAAVELVSRSPGAAGAWWYCRVGGYSGWLPESELAPRP